MGSCTSSDGSAIRTLTPEQQQRRLVRQTSSAEDLRKQVDQYHQRPYSPKKFEKLRPEPIAIENPNGPGSLNVSLNVSSTPSEDSDEMSAPTTATA